MSFSLNTNIGSMNSNLYANKNSLNQNKTLSALSSGDNLTQAANDAASLAISEKLLALVSGSGQAIQNSNESIGMIQIADGALGGMEDNLQRVRELTIQASNDTLTSGDREIIQKEIDGLLESSDDIASSTNYNGIKLLDATGGSSGDGTFVTQSGPDTGNTHSFSISDMRVNSLVGSIDITTSTGRDAAFASIESATESLSDTRAGLGASQNALMSSVRNTTVSQINAASASSQLRDVDFALESANFSRQNIMSQIGAFSQAQANSITGNLSTLLG